MTRYEYALTALDAVRSAVAAARAKYPDITDDRLELDGAIHYANGNDGTEFDWETNERLCEFFVYFREDPKPGFVMVRLFKDGTIITCIYPDGDTLPAERSEDRIDPTAVHDLAHAIYYAADDCYKFDCPIDELNWEAAETVMGRYPAADTED